MNVLPRIALSKCILYPNNVVGMFYRKHFYGLHYYPVTPLYYSNLNQFKSTISYVATYVSETSTLSRLPHNILLTTLVYLFSRFHSLSQTRSAVSLLSLLELKLPPSLSTWPKLRASKAQQNSGSHVQAILCLGLSLVHYIGKTIKMPTWCFKTATINANHSLPKRCLSLIICLSTSWVRVSWDFIADWQGAGWEKLIRNSSEQIKLKK